MQKLYNSLYSFNCDIDIKSLIDSCIKMEKHIKYMLTETKNYGYVNDIPHRAYNILSFPFPEIHKLYNTIKNSFYEVEKLEYGNNLKYNYFISCWINVLNQGESLPWHGHNYNCTRNWHGFYCVNAMPGCTTYKFKDGNILDIENNNNKLIIGLSGDSEHRTHPWTNESIPRITIAFDIIPDIFLHNMKDDRWIPI